MLIKLHDSPFLIMDWFPHFLLHFIVNFLLILEVLLNFLNLVLIGNGHFLKLRLFVWIYDLCLLHQWILKLSVFRFVMSFWRFIYRRDILRDRFIFINNSFSFNFEFNDKIAIILILLLIFIIIIGNLYWLNFTVLFIVKLFDFFLKFVLKLLVHVKFIELSLFESLVKLLNEIIQSEICPDNQYGQMSNNDVGYDFTTNDFMTDGFFHLFYLNKVNYPTGYKSNTEFVQES